ncbi:MULTISPECIES: hypothetical protein [unclassified Mesorhizobium]|uniref:hypothetical protein n=1 Tax=unclassified Mesorhizobium TaxID=325217 RepID=UPI0030145952
MAAVLNIIPQRAFGGLRRFGRGFHALFHGDAVVGVPDHSVERAEPVAFRRHPLGESAEKGFQIPGREVHLAQLRNMAQSHGWSIMRCNSSSRCMTVIEAPAMSRL